jgi:ATP:corrinoid adenosyltransferase
MAIMIPDTLRQSTPKSERRLFNRFRSELPDDCYVLHSLGLVNHKTKIWGECDFVILSRAGIYVIEVKGGRVDCKNGVWRFTRADGTTNIKPESPFEQAKNAMFGVRKAVEESQDLKGFLFGYGVIMPDDELTQTGPEIEISVLLDKRGISNKLDEYLKRLCNFWAAQYYNKHGGRIMRYPEKGDLEKIRAKLRPNIRTALTLNSILSRVDQEQVELTEQQSRILQRMDSNPRTLVRGGAGTGKTLLALDTAARRAGEGQRTLYLCYNKLLGRHIREHVRARYPTLPIAADNIHAWFHRIINEAGLAALLDQQSTTDEKFFLHHYPVVYQEALIQLNYEPFDCLILDEGQDLINHPYLDALDLTLSGGLNRGTWHIFLDPLQIIHSGYNPTGLERLKNYGYAEFQLTVNCRNTLAVALSASMISGLDIPLEEAVEGGEIDMKFIVRDGNQFKALERLIERLVKDDVSRDNIVILSKHPLRNSTLAKADKLAGSRIRDLSDDADASTKGIDFSTMHAFKGLERMIVIAWDLDDLDSEQNRLLHYCGLSRARSCLFTFINESERPVLERLATEFGVRQAKTGPPERSH